MRLLVQQPTNQDSFHLFSRCQRTAADQVQPAEAQAQPEAPHPLHNTAAALAGEEVPGKAVPEHRRTGGVLLLAAADGDAGEDLVPEPKGQGQAPPGGRDREDQDGGAGPRSTWCPVGHGRVLSSEPDAPGISGGPVGGPRSPIDAPPTPTGPQCPRSSSSW